MLKQSVSPINDKEYAFVNEGHLDISGNSAYPYLLHNDLIYYLDNKFSSWFYRRGIVIGFVKHTLNVSLGISWH